jgi:hypothetical protein
MWIDTLRSAGQAFAGGKDVVDGAGVHIADGRDGAAMLLVAYSSRAAAVEAANAMMGLARLYWLDEQARSLGDAGGD